jgi:SAM-dependent methyltransferase
VQIDRFAGHRLSTERFVADSRWPRDWLRGKLILDGGCGAGRFTDVAATLGARVVAIDLSGAVTAARNNTAVHGACVDIVQASLLRLPFRHDIFDGIFCMGVIQHTPDPSGIMANLPGFLKPGGRLCYNFYEVDWRTKFQPLKYALRWVTPHLPHAVNHALALVLTILFFPLSWLLSHVRYVRFVNVTLPICASHNRALTFRQQFLWTLLDTFDWYSPRYEIRQSHASIAALLQRAGLSDVQSAPGLAWALKPPGAAD